MLKKVSKIFFTSLPILLMIGLIPVIKNDYFLTVLYIFIIFGSLKISKSTKKDVIILVFGFVIMIIFEYIFISTGVETFTRNSLFGIMPLWLPFLWAYGFVAIKRSVEII
ncbi:MAG: hypothetical protein AB198_00935 [Parcubacteria bacterium C7867-003]|nr:MAG: hypothetical protein AB198_00935 [Parcubacteria bacterium C7867-003]